MSLGALNSDARAMLAQHRMDLNQCRMLQAELINEAHELTAQGVLDDPEQQAVEVAIDLARQLGQRHSEEQRRMNQDAVNDAIRDFSQGGRNGFNPRNGMPRVDPGVAWTSAPRLPGADPALAGKTMRALFGPPSTRNPWDSPNDFYSAVASGRYHPNLMLSQGMTEGNAPSGGFLVPEELAFELLDRALHQEVVRPYATVVPMTSRTKLVPSYDGMDQSATSRLYGFEFQWLEEIQPVTPGQGKLRALQLTAWSGGIYVIASNELALDAPNFDSDLSTAIVSAIAENMDDSYLNGDGVAKPQGLLKSEARYVVAKETSQGTGTVLWQNITKMYSRQARPQNAIWVCNPLVLPQLMSLTITIGTGGSHIPAVVQGNDGSLTMLARPLFPSSKAPAPGTEGDISFCDMSAYYVGLRKQVNLELSTHVAFTSNASVWRGIIRTDGMPKVSSPYIGADGQQYSPFVVLGARP